MCHPAAGSAALAAAPVETRYATVRCRIAFAHPQTPGVMRAAGASGAAIVGSSYDEDAHLVLEVRRSRLEQLRRSLVEATSGAVRFEAGTPEGADPPASREK